MEARRGIGARACGGDAFGIRSLVMRAVQMIVSKDGASAPTISSAFLSPDAPVTRIQSSAPWIALRLASDCRMPSGVWPTSITVSGSCWMTSSRPGQRVSRRPARMAASIRSGALRGCSRCSQSRNRVIGNGGVVELKRAGQAHFEAAKIMISELEIEMLP